VSMHKRRELRLSWPDSVGRAEALLPQATIRALHLVRRAARIDRQNDARAPGEGVPDIYPAGHRGNDQVGTREDVVGCGRARASGSHRMALIIERYK